MTAREAARPTEQHIETLARTYTPALKRFFERRILEHADVDDLVQEVFLRLTKRGSLSDVGNLEGYLFQTAANILRDRLRQRLSRRATDHGPLDDELPEAGAFSPERVAMGREAMTRFAAALRDLPPRARTVFALCRLESLSHAEVAARLGISHSSVEKHMVNAMKKLLVSMKDDL